MFRSTCPAAWNSRIGRRSTKVFCAFALAVIAAPALAEAGNASAPKHADQRFDLPQQKAEALFTLLAPDQVRVVVSHTPKGIRVEGPAREVAAVSDLVDILTRSKGVNYNTDADALAKLRQNWQKPIDLKLPAPVSDALFSVLAFDDVPILVARTPDGLAIEATQKDQQVLARIARIVQGQKLGEQQAQRERSNARREQLRRNTPLDRNTHAEKPAHRQRSESQGKTERRNVSPDHRLAQRIDRLAARVDDLERELAALDLPRREDPHHRDLKPEHRGDDHDRRANAGPMIDRRYRLPKEHADNLFALFAPADITDVMVSREGNQIRIRATERDQQTIKRLVDLLNRGSRSPVARDSGAHADASTP